MESVTEENLFNLNMLTQNLYSVTLKNFFDLHIGSVILSFIFLKFGICATKNPMSKNEKLLTSKIVYLKKIYKFYFEHFLAKRTIFILIEKTLLKNCCFRPNYARYKKMLNSIIRGLKKKLIQSLH